MTEPLVRLETDGRGVARVTVARAERRNAFDGQVIHELMAALGDIDLASRAVVLASDGTSFSAGAGLEWVKSMVDHSPAEDIRDPRWLAPLLPAVDRVPDAVAL